MYARVCVCERGRGLDGEDKKVEEEGLVERKGQGNGVEKVGVGGRGLPISSVKG